MKYTRMYLSILQIEMDVREMEKHNLISLFSPTTLSTDFRRHFNPFSPFPLLLSPPLTTS